MPPAQKPTGAEGAARALPREQPVTAAAVTPTPVNNESAGAEGAEFIAQDLSQDPPGNDDLLLCLRLTADSYHLIFAVAQFLGKASCSGFSRLLLADSLLNV